MLNNLQIFTWSTCIFPGSIQIPTSLFQGLALRLVGIMLYSEMEQWWIMIVHHHNHVSGPGVVSSGSRSRTVFRGASRDFHPRPNSQVFAIFFHYHHYPDFHHHYLRFKRIWSLFWGLTNIQIFCQHLGYCDVGPFWLLYCVIDIFIFPGTSFYHILIFPGTLTVRMRTVLTLTDLRYF